MQTASADILTIGGREVRLTRPDKVLFPEDGITKAGLIQYYEQVGPRIIPYLTGRPLTLHRFPDGIDQPGFIQNAADLYYPHWISRITVKKEAGAVTHVLCNDLATLVYLVNQACITFHVWLSRATSPTFPDQMVFDFDPATDDLNPVAEGATLFKSILDELDAPAFVKSTGSRGLQVVVPLGSKDDSDSVRDVARKLANLVIARSPDRFTLEQRKRYRQDRVLIDINRNGYAQTVVANYAVCARRGAPVAVPLDWGELREKGFRPDGVTTKTIHERLETAGDPWANFTLKAASLAGIRRNLEMLRVA